MSNPNQIAAKTESTARREFLGQIGKVAVTAPAVALLLTASAKPAAAEYRQRTAPRRRPGRSPND